MVFFIGIFSNLGIFSAGVFSNLGIFLADILVIWVSFLLILQD